MQKSLHDMTCTASMAKAHQFNIRVHFKTLERLSTGRLIQQILQRGGDRTRSVFAGV